MRKLMLLAAAIAAFPACSAEEGWMDLFNGRDLSGWTPKGGQARYLVENGCIVGETVTNTPNSFLCTEKNYENFTLELEFKVDPRLNSGVQIRSECFDEPTKVEWNGKIISIPAGRVHGYQVEIDADPAKARWWTGGIYDEARRNWMWVGPFGGETNTFTRQGRALFKTNDWNRLRVEAVGSSIKTFLNGVLARGPGRFADAQRLHWLAGAQHPRPRRYGRGARAASGISGCCPCPPPLLPALNRRRTH